MVLAADISKIALSHLVVIGSILGFLPSAACSMWVGVPPRTVLSLGSGYSPLSLATYASCLDGEVETQGRTTSSLFLNKPLTPSQLRDVLFRQGQLAWVDSNTVDSVGIPMESYPHQRSLERHYLAFFGGRKASFEPHGLNDHGRRVSQTSSKLERAEICGDRYISEVEIGGYFLVTTRYHFQSYFDKRRIEMSEILDTVDIGGFAMIGRNLPNSLKEKISIWIDIKQVGGSMSEFQSLFSNLSRDGLLSCTFPKIEKCITGLNLVQRYISDPTRLLAQFNTELDESSKVQPGILAARVLPINDVVAEFTPKPKPINQVVKLLDELANLINRESHLKLNLNSLWQARDLRVIASNYEKVGAAIRNRIDLLQAAINVCRNDFAACPSAVAKVRGEISNLPMPQAVYSKNFHDACTGSFRSLSDRRLLAALEVKFRSDDCQSLRNSLANATSLDLSNIGIDCVSLLWPFDNIVKLEIGRNGIEKITPQQPWPGFWTELAHLSAPSNKISEVSLSHLQSLQVVDVSDNEISQISPKKLPEKIHHLTLWGNELPEKKTRKQLESMVNILLLTSIDVCKHHGKRLVEAGLITVDELSQKLRLGQAPWYQIRSDGLRLLGWRNCEEIYRAYPEYIGN